MAAAAALAGAGAGGDLQGQAGRARRDRPAELEEPRPHDLGRLPARPRDELGGPRAEGVRAYVQGRPRPARLSEPAVRRHPARQARRSSATPVPRRTTSRGTGRATFYQDFLNTPGTLNRGHTIHEYWMEDSGGRYGVELDRVRAVPDAGQVPRVRAWSSRAAPPARRGTPAPANIRTDGRAAWAAAVRARTSPPGSTSSSSSAPGQDESSTWQEFGSDQVPHQGGRHRRLRPAGPGPAQLGEDPLRGLDLLGVGLDDLAERRRRLLHPGGELRPWPCTPTSSATSWASATTTTTRSACRRAARTPASGRCSAGAASTAPADRTAGG